MRCLATTRQTAFRQGHRKSHQHALLTAICAHEWCREHAACIRKASIRSAESAHLVDMHDKTLHAVLQIGSILNVCTHSPRRTIQAAAVSIFSSAGTFCIMH